jgi:hypothetical protein
MRQGRALDADIAMLVLGKRPAKPENIPYYSSDLYDGYKVVNALQSKGWHFNIKSEISTTGVMSYTIRFSQGVNFVEMQHAVIPLAICNCAIKIANGEIQEWQDPNRTFGVADVQKILAANMDRFSLPSENDISIVDMIGEDNNQKVPAELAKFLMGALEANGLVIKKADEDGG